METGAAEAYDVAVVGGGAAGVAAAIGAARLGDRTLLLEHMGFLGCAATARNVLTYCGLFTLGETPRQAVRCVADDVLNGLRRLNAVSVRYGNGGYVNLGTLGTRYGGIAAELVQHAKKAPRFSADPGRWSSRRLAAPRRRTMSQALGTTRSDRSATADSSAPLAPVQQRGGRIAMSL